MKFNLKYRVELDEIKRLVAENIRRKTGVVLRPEDGQFELDEDGSGSLTFIVNDDSDVPAVQRGSRVYYLRVRRNDNLNDHGRYEGSSVEELAKRVCFMKGIKSEYELGGIDYESVVGDKIRIWSSFGEGSRHESLSDREFRLLDSIMRS